MTFHCGWHLRNCSSYKDLEWIEIAFKITHERFLVVRRTYWLSSWKYPGYLGPLHVIKQIHPFHILRSSRYQRISKQMQTWSTMQSLAPCCEQDTKTPVATHIPISLYHYTSPSHQSTRLPQNIFDPICWGSSPIHLLSKIPDMGRIGNHFDQIKCRVITSLEYSTSMYHMYRQWYVYI